MILTNQIADTTDPNQSEQGNAIALQKSHYEKSHPNTVTQQNKDQEKEMARLEAVVDKLKDSSTVPETPLLRDDAHLDDAKMVPPAQHKRKK